MKSKDLAKCIDLFKNKTRRQEFEMWEVAEFALAQGVEAPDPPTRRDLMEKMLTRAARQQHRVDPVTGRTYRANHRIPKQGGGKGSIWFDLDNPPSREKVKTSLTLRREQVVSDLVAIENDKDRYNVTNPYEEPIQIELDFTFDVELRRNVDDDEAQKAS